MVKHLNLGGIGGAGMAGALDATFGALSDATRRGILARLALGESSVSELAAPYEMSLPAVSKHLRVLENAGLVTRHKDGRVHRCRLIAEPMKDAAEWIERYRMFWEEQFDALERYLAETGALTTSPKPELVPARAAKGIEGISSLKFEISEGTERTADLSAPRKSGSRRDANLSTGVTAGFKPRPSVPLKTKRRGSRKKKS